MYMHKDRLIIIFWLYINIHIVEYANAFPTSPPWGANQRRVYLAIRLETRQIPSIPSSFHLFVPFFTDSTPLQFLSFSSFEPLLSCDPMECLIF